MRELILASDVEKVIEKIGQNGALSKHTNSVFIPTASLAKNYTVFFDKVVRPNFLKLSIDLVMLEIA